MGVLLIQLNIEIHIKYEKHDYLATIHAGVWTSPPTKQEEDKEECEENIEHDDETEHTV